MKKILIAFAAVLAANFNNLYAQQPGTASGSGTIERLLPDDTSEQIQFAPKFSYAYTDSKKSTWIVLTESAPPLQEWLKEKDPQEARRLWCQKEKTPFVTLKLEPTGAVDLYFLCPANGFLNTEMLSTINGLDSIVVKIDSRSQELISGSLRTGEGNCPLEDGTSAYCTKKGDFTFSSPLYQTN